jgi:hypothetical protein
LDAGQLDGELEIILRLFPSRLESHACVDKTFALLEGCERQRLRGKPKAYISPAT